jgi:uncharacterized protein (DUF1684 family)
MVLAHDSYSQEISKWRQNREADLTADNGWLTLAGLFFLKQGKTSFGSASINEIVLPHDAPAEAGVLELEGSKVTLRAKVPLAVNGNQVTTSELKPELEGKQPDLVTIGGLTMFLHKSGDRIALRLRDINNEIRRNFTGLKWYPVREEYKVTARFEPYTTPRIVKVPNILGDLETYTAPGTVAFAINGQPQKLEVFAAGTGAGRRLFIVFRDLTSGRETYPSARFLYASAPNPNGEVVLDFNKAYNPPCAFNPHTTCPLPPEQNRMRVRIEAGELDYHPNATD